MLCVALPAQAQWKWKDAQGKVQYSDLPPPQGTPDKDILQRPPGAQQRITLRPFGASAADAASAPAAPAAAASAPAKTRAQEAEQLAKQRQEAKRAEDQKKENCEMYQRTIETLQSGMRIQRTDEKGERSYLDEKQIAAEVARTRAMMANQCR